MPDDPPDARQSLASSAWSLVKAVSDLVLDFSFKNFVTPKLVRIIYALSLLAALLWALTWMFGGFEVSITFGLFTLVTGPLAFFFYALCARVTMEFVLAIFSIEAEVRKLNEKSLVKRPDDLN